MSLPKDEFFSSMEHQGLGLTYADVRIEPGRSDVAVGDIAITSRFSTNVGLEVPMVSAAMDTVTTSDMAIAMAKLGGLGVIHCAMSPEDQAKEVRRVKHELNGKIEKPITIGPKQTIGQVLEYCDRKDFKFRTFPVTKKDGTFVGLITQNDFDFSTRNLDALVKDIMTPAAEVTTATTKTGFKKAFSLMQEHKKKTLPLIDEAGQVQAMYVLSDVLRLISGNPQDYNLDSRGRLVVAAAVPTDDSALERIKLMNGYLDVVVLDSAQGDSRFAFETLKKIKRQYGSLDVVVGNISNPNSAKDLADAGADGIKVGQGPGSICTTRPETGIGTPQITAVFECAKAVRGSKVPICADGGISNPGDFSVAIAAGASSIMVGSLLAGSKEAPGELISESGVFVKRYRGMGSPSALRDNASSRRRYDTETTEGKPLSEGVESYVPFIGSVDGVVKHYAKALRKGMSYVGSPNIKRHQKDTRFIRFTGAGVAESNPHDVTVIKN